MPRLSHTVTSALALVIAAALTAAAAAQSKPTQPTSPNPPAKKPGDTPPGGTQPDKPKNNDPRILDEGDEAPKLEIDTWVKGKKVEEFEEGTVYVVEFWATWCGPCVASIPKLTDLQKKYRQDLVIIGVAASERSQATNRDDRLRNLETFVKGKGKQMDYRVAYDADREMWRPWMDASGNSGIPTSFVIDHEGTIAWIGHPADLEQHVKPAVEKAREWKKTQKDADKPKKDTEKEDDEDDADDKKKTPADAPEDSTPKDIKPTSPSKPKK
jgi:thiol-disulfide isomerase/thioredoxin